LVAQFILSETEGMLHGYVGAQHAAPHLGNPPTSRKLAFYGVRRPAYRLPAVAGWPACRRLYDRTCYTNSLLLALSSAATEDSSEIGL
jgi:hypothetical protein